VIAYVHPWQIYPDQSRLNGGLVSRLLHYTHLNKTSARLAAMLGGGGVTSSRNRRLVDVAQAVDPSNWGNNVQGEAFTPQASRCRSRPCD